MFYLLKLTRSFYCFLLSGVLVISLVACGSDGAIPGQVSVKDDPGSTEEPGAETALPPDVTISRGPDPLTRLSNATFAFEADGDAETFECRLNSGNWESCISPVSYPDLADGEFVFEVRSLLNGHAGDAASWSWTVDATPPAETTFSFSVAVTHTTTVEANLTATDPHGPIEFRLQGDVIGEDTWRPLVTQTVVTVSPGDGAKHVEVLFRDGVGNVSAPLSATLEIDQTAPNASQWRQLSASGAHSCGIQADGTLWCWGSNEDGRTGLGLEQGTTSKPIQVSATADWTAVSAGGRHSCAIKNDGTLWCWGNNEHGRTGLGDDDGITLVPTHLTAAGDDWGSVSAGLAHTCARRSDGTLWCWGNNAHGRTGLGVEEGGTLYPAEVTAAGANWSSLDLGSVHSCAIKDEGTLWCWGSNNFGQTGLGVAEGATLVPTQVHGHADDWNSVAVAPMHTCATKTDGTLWCWGISSNGQGGLGSGGGSHDIPMQEVTGGVDWTVVDGGGYHSCALREDGTAWCTGWNDQGATGMNTTAGQLSTFTQVESSAQWSSLSTGTMHTCAIRKDGTLWCWGRNFENQLGTNEPGFYAQPTQERSQAENWSSLQAGQRHVCAVKTDGTLWCWGDNTNGKTGLDSGDGREYRPQQEATSSGAWESVAATNFHSCGIKSDGTLWCWGRNSQGELGVDDIGDDIFVPTQEATASLAWASSGVGNGFSCALKTDDTLWCWGRNLAGRTALGTEDGNTLVPTHVAASGDDWHSLSVGRNHACAIKNDHTLWCWGSNEWSGATGLDTYEGATLYPTQVTHAGDNWAFVSAGDDHSCAVKHDDTLWCWGADYSAELGLGEKGEVELTPVQVTASGDNWATVSTGRSFTCGIKNDQTLWCWGGNDFGRTAVGVTERYTSTLVPTQEMTGASDWVDVTAGHEFACARKDDGTLWCWGNNNYGQLTGVNPLVPGAVHGLPEIEAPEVTNGNPIPVILRAQDANPPIEMLFSGDDIVSPATDTWLPFASAVDVTVTSSPGHKELSVRFRDAVGNISDEFTTTVVLE